MKLPASDSIAIAAAESLNRRVKVSSGEATSTLINSPYSISARVGISA